MSSVSKYSKRGVSSQKEDVHNAIKHIDKGLFPKAFCKIVPDYLGGDPNYCIVMHADGAGTKSSLAYVYWKETGDLNVWKGIAQDAIVMNLDDLLCVGAYENILISSTIGRNKNHIPGEVITSIITGTEEVLNELRCLGIGIWSTGGETADVGDLVRTIIVDSTVVARMKKSDVISNQNIKAGDVIVGFASFGKTTYENAYNSGMGSNGLTSARHDVFSHYIASKYPESLDTSLPYELIYTGSYKPTDKVNDIDTDAGSLVLSPTRGIPLWMLSSWRVNRVTARCPIPSWPPCYRLPFPSSVLQPKFPTTSFRMMISGWWQTFLTSRSSIRTVRASCASTT
jgi:phosphoribosylformylglycinamidine cyclo-ligase